MIQHLHADAVHVLTTWRAPSNDQDALRSQYLEFLAAHPDAVSRICTIGHLTSSALVVNPGRSATLLTLHPKVGRWLQLGGHMEATDVDVRSAALRETREESGAMPLSLSLEPVRLDRHSVPCGGALSEHLDLQFIAVVSDEDPILCSEESTDLAWFSFDRLPADLDSSVRALIAAARVQSDRQVAV